MLSRAVLDLVLRLEWSMTDVKGTFSLVSDDSLLARERDVERGLLVVCATGDRGVVEEFEDRARGRLSRSGAGDCDSVWAIEDAEIESLKSMLALR